MTQVYPEVLSGRFRFTIHAVRRRSDPVAALEDLHAYADPNVRLIRDILPSPAYFALLASADIVLMRTRRTTRSPGRVCCPKH